MAKKSKILDLSKIPTRTYTISDEIKAKPVEWLSKDEKLIDYLKQKNCQTVGDAIIRINSDSDFDKEYEGKIKAKLIFGIDLK